MKKSVWVIHLMLMFSFNCQAQASKINNQTCGITPGHALTAGSFGPFDYRDPTNRVKRLHIVESAHFTSEVERLESGANGAVLIAEDIAYTLRKFPNHHRALNAMARLQRRQDVNVHKVYALHCYFARAKYFAANDANVWLIEAIHYHLYKNHSKAKSSYNQALKLAPKHAEVQYNYGLFLFEQGHYKQAKVFADKAYASGYPLQGLNKKLMALNSQ